MDEILEPLRIFVESSSGNDTSATMTYSLEHDRMARHEVLEAVRRSAAQVAAFHGFRATVSLGRDSLHPEPDAREVLPHHRCVMVEFRPH